jgi:hypothetical protein
MFPSIGADQKVKNCQAELVEDRQFKWLAIPLGLKSHFDRLCMTVKITFWTAPNITSRN